MRKRLIVTGFTGFIGRYVVSEFLNNGYEIFGISRHRPSIKHKNVHWIEADICNEFLGEKFKKIRLEFEGIIHLAANIEVPGNQITWNTNVYGTYNILLLAKKLGIKKGVFFSSVPVIGIPRNKLIDESHIAIPNTLYHTSKLLGEKLIELENKKGNFWTILRIPSPIGIGMRNSFFKICFDSMLENKEIEIYGKGKRIQSYIDVRDVASGVVKAFENAKADTYLLTGKKAISNEDLVNRMKVLLESCSRILYKNDQDVDDDISWNLSSLKAEKAFGYKAIYSIDDTIRWMNGEK